jgi:hypothetical protein
MSSVELLELNVAVSVLLVPDVAPGTFPETQFDVVDQVPVAAVELHVPLAANDGELSKATANTIAQPAKIEDGII